MREPQSFFPNPVEKELAAETWKVGGNPETDPAFVWYQPHEALYHPRNDRFANQLIAARNWITAMRDQPSAYWGNTAIERVKAYFKHKYNRDIPVNNTHIGNVEHFFTSALIAGVTGQFFIVGAAFTAVYEVILQPVAVGAWNLSFTSAWNNLKNNWTQLTGPDKNGVTFVLLNSRYSQLDIQKFFSVEPEVLPPGTTPPPRPPTAVPTPPVAGKTIQVQAGQSLSVLAGKLYKSVELWPLIWDENKTQLPNPNKTKPGMVLQYKELHEYSQAQIADARRRSPTWRQFPQ